MPDSDIKRGKALGGFRIAWSTWPMSRDLGHKELADIIGDADRGRHVAAAPGGADAGVICSGHARR